MKLMFYNRDQFNKDLCLIVQVFGERSGRGYYTEGVYEDGDVIIKDSYVHEPQIFWRKNWIGKDDIKMTSFIAEYVMKKAMLAEEVGVQNAYDY